MSPGATWAISHDGLIHLKKDDLIALKGYLLEIAHDVRVVFMYVMRYLMPLAQKTSVLKQARCISWIKPLYIKYTGILPKFVEVFGLEKIEARLFYKDALNCGDVVINFINANWGEDMLSNIQKPLGTSFQPNLSLDADS